MNHLGVFAKYWLPGSVKTRLAVSIGLENAASLYREFIRQTLARHAKIADSRAVYVWPADRRAEFAEVAADSWSVDSQTDGDLGQRMLYFFQQTLALDAADRSVLIGSDSPRLPSERILEAIDALDSHSLVLGPSQDGGYYLIGMSGPVNDVFEGVTWSTPQVFQQTITLAKRLGLSWHRLPEYNDIDDLDDLRMLEQEIVATKKCDPLDQRLLEAIQRFGVFADE